MINICISEKDKTITVEGYPAIPLGQLNSPSQAINLIEIILNKAYYSGERLCLEFQDATGGMHEIERYD